MAKRATTAVAAIESSIDTVKKPLVMEAQNTGNGRKTDRVSVRFHHAKYTLIQQLQEQMKTNEAWVRNAFPRKLADLIQHMQGEIKFEVRKNGSGNPFQYGTIHFPDGSTAGLPTEKSLDQKIEQNEFANRVQAALRGEETVIMSAANDEQLEHPAPPSAT